MEKIMDHPRGESLRVQKEGLQEVAEKKEKNEKRELKEPGVLVVNQQPAIIVEAQNRVQQVQEEEQKSEKENKEHREVEVGMERQAREVMVTGGTGFVGSNLIYELINRGYKVYALTRPKSDFQPTESEKEKRQQKEQASERIAHALRVINPDFNTALADAGIEVIPGDITLNQLGLDEQGIKDLKNIESIFHSAASVSFREEERNATININFHGTKKVIDLIYALGDKPHLHHLSTAYIVGDYFATQQGKGVASPIFKETDLNVGQQLRNPYEQSKFSAEKEIDADPDLMATIYRLGIVIGDTKTSCALTFTGYYGFWRSFWVIKNRIENLLKKSNIGRLEEFENFDVRFEGEKLYLPIAIPGDPMATANLVPVDWVVKTIVALSEIEQVRNKRHTFHLTHDNPPQYHMLVKTALEELGMEGVYIDDVAVEIFKSSDVYKSGAYKKHPDPTIRYLGGIVDGIKEYLTYIKGEPIFDKTQLKKMMRYAKVPVGEPPDITEDFIRKKLRHAIDSEFRVSS